MSVTATIGDTISTTGKLAARLRLFASGGHAAEGLSRAKPVATEMQPPTKTEVVVIGGGIIGAMTAFRLAERGIPVVLCEKGAIGGEASSRALGQLRSGGLATIKLPIIDYARHEWAMLNDAVAAETGYRQDGWITTFHSEAEAHFWEGWLKQNRQFEPRARLLSAAETRSVLGGGNWVGAYFNPADGRMEPTLATSAIAEAAKHHGAKLIAPCAVRGIETRGGRIVGVVTEAGPIAASAVVLAGGSWSSLFARNMGIYLPTLSIFSMAQSVYGVEGPVGIGDLPTVTWRKQIDGGYTIAVLGGTIPVIPDTFRYGRAYWQKLRRSAPAARVVFGRYFFEQLKVPVRWQLDETSPFERVRVMQPALNRRLTDMAAREIQTHLPVFSKMRIGEIWSGAIVNTPDNLPVLSAVDSVPGLFFAAGLNFGVTMGPAAGTIMADLVMGRAPAIDISAFRYGRFIDGSQLTYTD